MSERYSWWSFSTLAALLAFMACAPPPAPVESPPPAPVIAGTPPGVEPPPIEAGVAPPPGPYAPGFDALHYDFEITLPDAGDEIRGRATAVIRLEGERRDTLPLDLTGLAVDTVRVAGQAVGFHYDDGKLRIPVPAAARVGDTLRVEVVYGGTPDDGLIIGENVHGARTVFADNWPNRARFWFPSIDHPSDRATVAFTVRAPPGSGWSVIANGERQPQTDPDVWSWTTTEAIPTYTMVIGAAEFVIDTIGVSCPSSTDVTGTSASCAETTTWIFPPDTARAAPSFRRSDEMVVFYSELIAPFPYVKLAHVQSSTRFGGMENVSAIFYSEQAIAEGRDIEGTVAHEVAHQWFGDAVTIADWHHLWLSEGFASYFGPLFFEHADGVDRFREIMEEERQGYLRSDVVGQPMVNPDEQNLFELLNANSYNKGAWVLHMLRGVLGDSIFFAGVRDHYREHRGGAVLTEDFRRVMETASGRELEWFFEQWVFRPGHPRYQVDWEWDAATGEAEVTVEQVQPAEWPTFRMPVELEFVTPDGAIRRTVEVGERREIVRVPLPAEPTEVRLDPDGWILKEMVEGEMPLPGR